MEKKKEVRLFINYGRGFRQKAGILYVDCVFLSYIQLLYFTSVLASVVHSPCGSKTAGVTTAVLSTRP